ncbi:type II toxin-antitoxin system RelE/ParE family toxin [Anaerocolumna xylanovorans]|uniref:Addiction module toxin, RelE/StbE family n=1 Tax=Anaerocolumna xylanovorans DSM 12503 TaxID=1121345 RepID=A0A1M7Y0S4_9FIRM|nr:type II toxin-antitoxin system RelE/ParE family toxin [Anaerocolumna xylanovorans]SHO45236.1 addiction module toxin, RelE/StbE family [Anaerocolumna xylanovorans DSM 12503]SHO54182.1 addiction module toxin, RelE/StbE family [Anaerocolumna xylanovorans DSM 12503]
MENDFFHILYTPLAYEDLDEIDTYISEILVNPQAAEDLMNEMEKSISRLEQFPYIGSEVADPYLASKGYRKLVVQNYLVFHLINPEQKQVVIMRVLYGAREYHNLL